MSNVVHPCYRAAADCGILTQWPKETMTAQELAQKTGADARLIARLMRILNPSGVFKEVGEETYSHNGLSTTLSIPAFLGMLKFTSPGVAKLPEYLTATDYKNPGSTTGTATPFQYGNNTPLSFYQALAKNSKARAGFDDQMKRHVAMERAKSQMGFASIYDFQGEIGPLITSSEEVSLVDVGGSQGHVLEDVKKHLPDLKGRLVLEELPETLGSVKVPEGVEAVPYNFLESVQPVKGAACYLFRQIFLNWSDENGKQILKNTLPALKKGHSRVLIMEPVLPPVGAPLQAALMDIQMMQMGGGLRTEKQWRAFLSEAGFEVVRLFKSNSVYAIIEAIPKN
ncbi:S-adenosyl-L-methionine-dependent methyltransferase [Acephala macrosclerotiorum]|nr:S-adenosyl-L-methionine-dependent methyltransferase [Acephala macrosclerotiorum]